MNTKRLGQKEIDLLSENGFCADDINDGFLLEFYRYDEYALRGLIVFDVHEQDCCECVYADWKAVEHRDFYSWEQYHSIKEFIQREMELVKGYGFRLGRNFIPCYNEQNGYYSDELELVLFDPVSLEYEKIDLKNYKIDDID